MKKTMMFTVSLVMAGAIACGATSCTKIEYDAVAFDSPDATITANLNGASVDISDTLFGVFLEDINYASYVLDDNMIVNSSFEATQGVSSTYGWSASGASLVVEDTDGVLANVDGYKDSGVNTHYAKLTVNSAGGTLSNSGYDAVKMAVEKGTKYVFSAFIKTSESLNMTVSVEGKYSTCLSETIQLDGGSEWVKYTRTIKATDTDSSTLSLVLTFSQAATVYLDAITLETTDSTCGITQYMYDAIADLAPKFIRFPGGCIVEGNGYFNQNGENSLNDTAYDWKNSIGAAVTGDGDDVVPAFSYKVNTKNGTTKSSGDTYGETSTRMPNRDLWGGTDTKKYYDMEYGVGFYEYFLLCDSLGASAVPVLNCGYSCQGGGASNPRALKGRHGNGVQDYIQDALDLVAFAKGNVNSSDENEAYWAGIRAKMGHEEPFEMTYLGIGNEQWDVYYTYYQKFVEAFKSAAEDNYALYGDIQLIVGNGTQLSDCEGYNGQKTGTAKTAALAYQKAGKITNLTEYGVHDQHYYRNYTEFLELSTMYDNYSREEESMYYVFVGEYSANESNRLNGNSAPQTNNSWLTALSEAAYMTGLERNGDIVKLAAYAPMFASSTYSNQWAADMMFYTNTAIAFTPNYYVQQLYMKNQGSKWLESSIEAADGFTTTFTTGGYNVDKLYYSVCYDEDTKDIIVKIINACDEAINVNVALTLGSNKVKGTADVTVLQNDVLNATSGVDNPAVYPETFKIGVDSKLGYTAEKYSVTCIRIPIK